jgi:hypothetical protein
VELTDEESKQAIFEAKRTKFFRLQDEKKQNERLQAVQEANRMWSFEEQKQKALAYATALAGKPYELDEFSEPVFNMLCQYFTNSPEFEKDGRSLQKGLFLMGGVGVGKTIMLQAFAKNKQFCFLPVQCKEVEENCRKHGVEYWKTYTGYVPGHGGTPAYFFQTNIGWMLDDLGTEKTINDYGNVLEPMENIIHTRYAKRFAFDGLHITSNLNGKGFTAGLKRCSTLFTCLVRIDGDNWKQFKGYEYEKK